MTNRAEIAAIHKASLRRNRPSLIRSFVVRILGGQSLMLGNSADNPSPTTFAADTCYAFNLTAQDSLAVVTTGTTTGVLGETRLGAVCPVIDYAKRRNELLGENTIFVQLAWSGSAVLQSTTNALSARWDTLAGESGFLTSSNLTDDGTNLNPVDRIGMMDRLRAVVAVNPKIDLGAVEFHWQQGHADAPSIYNGTSSAADYRAALDRIRSAVKTNYGAARVLVWAHGWVKQTGATTQEVLNATHSLIHVAEDDFVADHADVVFASLACREVLSGNMVVNGSGEWVSGGADGLLPDGVHLNATFARAIGRRAAADLAD
jgi:hypothetical protein